MKQSKSKQIVGSESKTARGQAQSQKPVRSRSRAAKKKGDGGLIVKIQTRAADDVEERFLDVIGGELFDRLFAVALRIGRKGPDIVRAAVDEYLAPIEVALGVPIRTPTVTRDGAAVRQLAARGRV